MLLLLDCALITDLEPDIPECEVKWALGSTTMNKASGGDGIPVELFQILKDDAVKSQGRWDPDSLRPAVLLGGQASAWECSPGLSQHYLLGFEIAQLEFHHLH